MTEAFKIDRLDLRILAQLQKNGRMTNVDLADAVGLSPSPCLIRVKRLEQAGYIAGYGAHLRLEKLGDTLTVFTEVTLSDHRREDFARFEAAIREVDEVLECHLVSGGYDYLLQELGLQVTAVIEPRHGVEPTARQLAETIDRIKAAKVNVLFAEKYFASKLSDTIRQATGVRMYSISHISSGPYTPGKFVEEMNENLATLAGAIADSAKSPESH